MKILLDESKRIIGYATVGGVLGGVEVGAEAIPSDFEENFWPEKWAYEDGRIVRTDVPRQELKIAPDPLEQRLEEIEAGMCELAELLMGGEM